MISDIETMPGFDPKVPNGAKSVSAGLIYRGLPASGNGLETVCCAAHGAVLCVASNDAGKIWRCPACNEGAFQWK
jgi:hypothetical protein